MENREHEIEKLTLTPDEKVKIFESYPCLDPSFEEDYKSEVDILLEAQIKKVLAGYRLSSEDKLTETPMPYKTCKRSIMKIGQCFDCMLFKYCKAPNKEIPS